MSAGFYLMHRGWMDNDVLSVGEEPFDRRSAWAWMIERAAWRDTEGDDGVALQRGELIGHGRKLARAWRWEEPRVRRFLASLQRCGMVSLRTVIVPGKADAEGNALPNAGADARRVVITLCNYSQYQGTPTHRPTQEPTQEPTHSKKESKQDNNPSPTEMALPASPSRDPIASVDEVPCDLAGPIPGPSARQILWNDGLKILVGLTGKKPSTARTLLIRLVQVAGDDASAVMAALHKAQTIHPLGNAEAWLMKACQVRGAAAKPAAKSGRLGDGSWMLKDPIYAAMVGRPTAPSPSPDFLDSTCEELT